MTLPPAEEVERGTVDGVIDGDTLQAVVEGQRVEIRLIGVDAPEAADCYGGESRTALSSLVTGQTVALTTDGAEIDSSGRWLRYVIVESTPPVLVNAELVSAGAVVPVHSGHAQQEDFMARGIVRTRQGRASGVPSYAAIRTTAFPPIGHSCASARSASRRPGRATST